MTKERYEELDKMTMEELLKNPCVSSDEFNFLLNNCNKNINEIEFD